MQYTYDEGSLPCENCALEQNVCDILMPTVLKGLGCLDSTQKQNFSSWPHAIIVQEMRLSDVMNFVSYSCELLKFKDLGGNSQSFQQRS